MVDAQSIEDYNPGNPIYRPSPEVIHCKFYEEPIRGMMMGKRGDHVGRDFIEELNKR